MPHRVRLLQLVDLQKYFLNDVLGVGGMAQDAQAVANTSGPYSRTMRSQSVTVRLS